MAIQIDAIQKILTKEPAAILGAQITLAVFVRGIASNFAIWGRQLILSEQYGLAASVKETALQLQMVSVVLIISFGLQFASMFILSRNKELQKKVYFVSFILTLASILAYAIIAYTAEF